MQQLELLFLIFVTFLLFHLLALLALQLFLLLITLNFITVRVGEEGNHAVVERLEASQVGRCSFCPGAVLRT